MVGGVVYLVWDDVFTIAVEEPLEEGLNQPLRLVKLANEVWGFSAFHLFSGAGFLGCLGGVQGLKLELADEVWVCKG